MTLSYERFKELLVDVLMLDDEPVEPDTPLVEELGLQSIDVVELVERVEEEVGQPLEGLDLAHVETVRDLFVGLTRAGQAEEAPVHEQAVRAWLAEDPLDDVETLAQLWERRTTSTPDRVAVHTDEGAFTYGTLGAQADRVAHALVDLGVLPGDRVLLVLGNTAGFFPAFYGILRAAAVAVPTFHVPQPDRIARIAGHCGARVIVTARPLARPVRKRLEARLDGEPPVFIDLDALLTSSVTTALPPSPGPSDLAMLQYTSGTTGDAKGVMLTHGALVANVRQAVPRARFTATDVFVSWLPVYHDMGLITMTMCPFYLGAQLVLLPVRLDPAAWLSAIAAHLGTVTAAPDFAYRYALKVGGDLSRFDCRSLRMALVAAEPVRASTIQRFEAALGLTDVLRPGYGLAESCVAVTFTPFDQPGVRVDDRGRVCVGPPVPGTTLTIRDEDGRLLPAGTEGEVCLQGPSQTTGYFRNPDATAALFTRDGAVRTGDVGYLDAEGRLTIVDRRKNLLVVAGRSLSPKELEEVVDGVPGVERAMVVGIDEGGDAGEQVHVVAESPTDDGDLPRTIRRALQEQMAIRVKRVHLVPPNALPRTYNGKYRYPEMRRRLLEGSSPVE